MIGANAIDLEISIRDAHGNVVDTPAVVHLTSLGNKYNGISSAENLIPPRFQRVTLGEYQIEVTCPGFQKTRQTFLVDMANGGMPIYVYLLPESASTRAASANPPVMLPPQFRSDLERGIEALRKGHYSSAQKTLTKLAPKSHDNPDVLYNLGLAELGMQHEEQARSAFQQALVTDPNHAPTLVALAHMEMRSGSPAAAVPFLEKASSGATNWRTDFDLATAEMQLNRLTEAESAASRATRLARNRSAAPSYLLGQIRYAAGRRSYARLTWESMLTTFPSDPLTEQARKNLAQLDFSGDSAPLLSSAANVPGPALGEPVSPAPAPERPWAPPDIDDVVSAIAPEVSCTAESVLDQAFNRMKSQLLDPGEIHRYRTRRTAGNRSLRLARAGDIPRALLHRARPPHEKRLDVRRRVAQWQHWNLRHGQCHHHHQLERAGYQYPAALLPRSVLLFVRRISPRSRPCCMASTFCPEARHPRWNTLLDSQPQDLR